MSTNQLSKKLIAAVLSIVLLASFFGILPDRARASQNCDVSPTLLLKVTKETDLLGLINTYRQQNNLGTLTWSNTLKQAAAWQSNDMYTHNSFNHIDSLGRDPATRISDCGYVFTSYAENIEQGSTTAQAVFDAWKNSPTHNANMLSATVKEAGISAINGYWTLDLGSSSAVSPTGTGANPTPSPTILPSISPSVVPSPTPTPAINTNPTDTQIDISIKLPGVGETGNKSPKHLTRQVVVGVFDSDNQKVLSGNGFLKYDGKNLFEGVIHLGQLADGTYTIKVQSSDTLISLVFPQFQNLTNKSVNILPFVPLTAGDFNNDNVIDIHDYNLALSCFQNTNCPSKTNVDLNDNGKNDVIDYNLFLSDFKQYEGD